jgi:hypothetical protein
MHGSTISLACFHGLNFRSQSWALFSLKHPFIAFTTEAQDLPPATTGDQSQLQNAANAAASEATTDGERIVF